MLLGLSGNSMNLVHWPHQSILPSMQLLHPSLSVPQQHTCLIVIRQASPHLRVLDIDFGDKIHSRTSSQLLSLLCTLLIDSPQPNLLKSYCEV